MKQRLLVLAAACGTALTCALPVQAAMPDSHLLATYVQFDPNESLFPTGVESFITDATLERANGTAWEVADPDPGPGGLPSMGGT